MSARSVVVIATPGFSPFHVSVPCIIFGTILAGEALFDVKICAEQPGAIASDIGVSMNVEHGLGVLDSADIIIVPFWNHPEKSPSQNLMEALSEAWLRGAEIVGLCLGTYVLAYAGLLDNRRAATHWECERDFRTRFPAVRLDTNSLYVSDERLITSAGTAAGIDCCLNIVRQHYGSQLANRAARRMVIPPYREGGQAQFIERPVPETTSDLKINDLLAYLRRNLAQPHDLDSLAHFTGMSRRTFTRHFFKATGMSPGDWLTYERLQFSQQLLETTDHTVETIAGLCGFQAPVSFRQSFRSRFDVSPTEWRRRFRGTRDPL